MTRRFALLPSLQSIVRALTLACLASSLPGADTDLQWSTQQPRVVHSAAGQSDFPAAERDGFNVLPGFQVELLYTVPRDTQGSWVSLTLDDRGRVIASDQEGQGLYRIVPAALGSDQPTRVEKLEANISGAQGLLYAFDSLYLSVNRGPDSGLYRLRDTNGDDQFNEIRKLAALRGKGEHGPHALRLSPDGKSIYLVCGNNTDVPATITSSRIPTNWSEDLLLPRQWDARGHARGRMAPGGWVAKTDPDGETWEIFSIGYRNPYDMDFNADGELFVYDADMEWDMGTPWYRPTRVLHATSGSEFGWRGGTGKWPPYYVDSLPPLLDIGPGSPVGVTFGYGANFPAQYQKALFLLDWTFGTIYAVHIQPHGASYRGVKEEFLSRTPLPLTDVAVGPDGAMYFITGGRGTQSELYRVTYLGPESTAPVREQDGGFAELRGLRRQLESLHGAGSGDRNSLDLIFRCIGHADRHIRYAARIALEFQDPTRWQDRVLAETDPAVLITGMVALARRGDKSLLDRALAALERLDYALLSETQQMELLRAYQLLFTRLGKPDQAAAARLARRLDKHYPAANDSANRELCTLLVYLNSPKVVGKTLELMDRPTEPSTYPGAELVTRNSRYGDTIAAIVANQPEPQKIHYALALRNMRYGWTLEQRTEYFAWISEALTKRGGSSYEGFLKNIRSEALANVSPAERRLLDTTTIEPAETEDPPAPIGPGREWTVSDLVQLAEASQTGRNFENGRRTFAAAQCAACHRFDGEAGATGPDLSNVAGRFSIRDLAEAMINPGKVISDQYQASNIVTADGLVYTGRIVGQQHGRLMIQTDAFDTAKLVEIAADEIALNEPSKTSLMPSGLLNPLNQDEVLDLLAYLMSRGDPDDRAFAPQMPSP